jgi:hypothetical protein
VAVNAAITLEWPLLGKGDDADTMAEYRRGALSRPQEAFFWRRR